jgi:hypothetical protein
VAPASGQTSFSYTQTLLQNFFNIFLLPAVSQNPENKKFLSGLLSDPKNMLLVA